MKNPSKIFKSDFFYSNDQGVRCVHYRENNCKRFINEKLSYLITTFKSCHVQVANDHQIPKHFEYAKRDKIRRTLTRASDCIACNRLK